MTMEGLLILFLIIGVVYFLIKSRKKNNQEQIYVNEGKREVAEKNEESSIDNEFAERFLPSLENPQIFIINESTSKENRLSKKFECPPSCSECFSLTERISSVYGNFTFDLGNEVVRGFEFIVAPMGFPFEVGGSVLFAAFTPERKLFHFMNLSEWKKNKEQQEKIDIGAAFVKSSTISREAFFFKENFYQGYALFTFTLEGLFPYMYGALFSLFPTQVEKAAEFFHIPALALIPERAYISGICKRGKDISLIVNFEFNGMMGIYRILPGRRKYPVVIEKLENTPGEFIPKALHLPFVELFLFGRSHLLKTSSFGKAFEIAYLRGEIPKSGLKKLLTFFLERPQLPELNYILRLYLKYEVLDMKTLFEFSKKVILQEERAPVDRAFAYRILAEYSVSIGEEEKALKYAKKALSLDENVGVKRLISKLEKSKKNT